MAVSTLVVMVLGILILGGGILLIGKISSGGTDLAKSLSAENQRELERMMSDGYLVAVTPSHQRMAAGKAAEYGVGVLNIYDDTDFGITVAGDENVDISQQGGDSGWQISYRPTLQARHDERATARIVIRPGKAVPAGNYTFFVNVTRGGDIYDSPRFFTARVQ